MRFIAKESHGFGNQGVVVVVVVFLSDCDVKRPTYRLVTLIEDSVQPTRALREKIKC